MVQNAEDYLYSSASNYAKIEAFFITVFIAVGSKPIAAEGDLFKTLHIRAGWRTEDFLIKRGQYDYWKPLLDLAKTNF